MKQVEQMTIKELLQCRVANWDEEIVCRALIIIPGSGAKKELHESGYRTMTFVATDGPNPICKISGCSDVIHVGGIGGLGYRWLEKFGKVPDMLAPHEWSIDCLPKSGCLRIFSREKIRTGAALSSFEIFSEPGGKP